MIYFTLFLEFMKIGLFSVGGGLASIPFLYELADKYSWFTSENVADMIAISESTPGPIGVNMATYAGFQVAGILGSIVSTIGMIIPEVVIVLIVAKVLEKFKESSIVKSAFYGIRPTVTALICLACLEVVKISIFRWAEFVQNQDWSILINYPALAFFGIVLFLVLKFHKHPILYILLGAVVGLVAKF